MKDTYQQEANQLIKELENDLNKLLPDGTRCMRLLEQEVEGELWKGRFQGYREGKPGIYQFSLDLLEGNISLGEEIE